MTRSSLLPITVLILACADGSRDATAPVAPLPVPVEYTVSGIVRDQAGRPLSGATAEIRLRGLYWKSVVSDSSGRYALRVVEGGFLFRLWKDWYQSYAEQLTVRSDATIDAQLTRLPYSDTIAYGHTVQSYVHTFLPPCDPVHWDAHAPCRVFVVNPPYGGVLTITVAWDGPADALDVAIISANGAYLGTSYDNPSSGNATARAFVEPGSRYEVRVSSYYDDQVFDLSAELRPGAGYRPRTTRPFR